MATIILTSSTDFTVRDLYMSLGDTNGNSWSILFDNPDVMNNCIRVVVATVTHLASHSEVPIAWETMQRSLPSTGDAR